MFEEDNFASTILAPKISARVISAWMFHHRNILAHAQFGAVDLPADGCFNTGTFRHGDFLAWAIFGTRKSWHKNILAHYTTMKSIIPSLNIFDCNNFFWVSQLSHSKCCRQTKEFFKNFSRLNNFIQKSRQINSIFEK